MSVSFWLDTLRALAAPRRAVPIGALAGSLLLAQAWYAPDFRLPAGTVAVVLAFLATAPHLWRLWRPADPDRAPVPAAGAALVALWALGTAAIVVVPRLTGLAASFLDTGLNGVVVGALFWVGGWGLARDVDLEAGLRRQRERAEALARHAEQAELLALKASLDPHFLFNTLNAIAQWCADDPAVAEAALLRLAHVLREVMGGVRADRWPLARELALARDVGALYATRDPERFRVEVDDVDADVAVPPLLLLPVVENALVHGPGAGHAGVVTVRVTVGDDVRVRVVNPGLFAGPREGGEGLGLVTRRAALAGGRFEIAGAGGTTTATVVLPR